MYAFNYLPVQCCKDVPSTKNLLMFVTKTVIPVTKRKDEQALKDETCMGLPCAGLPPGQKSRLAGGGAAVRIKTSRAKEAVIIYHTKHFGILWRVNALRLQ